MSNKTCIVQCRITADEKAAFELAIGKNQPSSGLSYPQSKILRDLIRDYSAYYNNNLVKNGQ